MTSVSFIGHEKGHIIGIARPLAELIEHFNNDKMPSLRLIARTIKVLILAIFRGHLCDHIIFPEQEYLCHSMRGRITILEDKEFQKAYPYMLDNAIFLRVNKLVDGEIQGRDLPEGHSSITAQLIVEYYRTKHKIEITSKKNGNTISDLLSSHKFIKIK